MEEDLPFILAEGFALLGMRREAMQALKELPLTPQDREISELLLDLKAATARAWAAGEAMAREVQPGDPIKHREGAGRFWLGRAVSLCAEGDYVAAKRAVSQLVQIWPEGRQEALDCEGLNRIW